jgi:cyclophilin family peptidyl-prolyl cis-trans isomerase
MANDGRDSNTCHFSILMAPAPHLDGHYVIFGEVVSGMDVSVSGAREARRGCLVARSINQGHSLSLSLTHTHVSIITALPFWTAGLLE